MIRPLVIQGSPEAPEALTATAADGPAVTLDVDGADLPAAGRRLRGGARRRRGLPQGPRVLRGRGRRRVSFTDDSAQAGRTYFYRVRAEADTGYSPWSAPAEVTLP